MPPFAGGKIAPALLLRRHPEKVELPSGIITLAGHEPIIESDISPDKFAFAKGLTATKSFGNTNAVPLRPNREILRTEFGSPPAGHLLVCCFGSGGYLGEGQLAVRNTVDLLGWEGPNNVAAIRTASDTGEFTARVTARVSTGDDFDSAVLFSNGQFPSFFSITDFGYINGAAPFLGQNMWTTNRNAEVLGGFPMIMSDLFQGSFPQYTLSIFCSVKRASVSAGETSSGPIPVGQGITDHVLGTVDGDFDNGLIFAAGWKMTGLDFSGSSIALDDWMPSIGFSGDSFSVAIKYMSTYSVSLPSPPL